MTLDALSTYTTTTKSLSTTTTTTTTTQQQQRLTSHRNPHPFPSLHVCPQKSNQSQSPRTDNRPKAVKSAPMTPPTQRQPSEPTASRAPEPGNPRLPHSEFLLSFLLFTQKGNTPAIETSHCVIPSCSHRTPLPWSIVPYSCPQKQTCRLPILHPPGPFRTGIQFGAGAPRKKEERKKEKGRNLHASPRHKKSPFFIPAPSCSQKGGSPFTLPTSPHLTSSAQTGNTRIGE